MQTIHFDNQDPMPIVGLGTWKSAPNDVYRAVKTSIRAGYRHIDCAPIYDNEPEIGRALTESFQEGLVEREQMFIVSKLWNNAHEPDEVQPAVEKTLADLNLDYLDLYLIHWPVALVKSVSLPGSAKDLRSLESVPLSETWSAMEALKAKGRCRHIGVSNFSIAKLQGLVDHARLRPEMNQIELHPYLQQTAMLDYCRSKRIHLTAYSPLGSFDRPASIKAKDEPILLDDPTIGAIAERRGATPAQVLISWAIRRGTAVIPKTVTPARMSENLAAVSVSLTETDLQAIQGLDRHRRYVDGSFWTMPGSPYTLANLWDE